MKCLCGCASGCHRSLTESSYGKTKWLVRLHKHSETLKCTRVCLDVQTGNKSLKKWKFNLLAARFLYAVKLALRDEMYQIDALS